MTHVDAAQNVSLSYYFDVVRRRWWIVLICAALGVGASAGYLYLVPQQFTATATVSLSVISTDPFNPSRPGSALIDTAGEALLASSSSVAERSAEALASTYSPEEIRRSLDVRVVSSTTILRISSTRANSEDARAIADATAESFLAYRSEQAQARIDRTVEATRDRVEPLREELALTNTQLATAEQGSLEATQAETDRSLISSELAALFDQTASLEGIDTTGGSVVSSAVGNAVEAAPQSTLVLATGLLAGAGVGILAAFAAKFLTARVRDPQDVVQNGGRVVLGELSERRVMIPPTEQDLDGFRAIRERLLADTRFGNRAGVCSMVDLTPPEHSSDVALNLALVMAASGVPTEYIALNLSEDQVLEVTHALSMSEDSKPATSGRRFTSPNNPGFALYVAPSAESLIEEEPISRAVREEIEARREHTLFVLRVPHDATPSTRLAAYRLSDTLVLLAARGHTRVRQLAQASQDMRMTSNGLVGTVMVRHSRQASIRSTHEPASTYRRLTRA